MWRNNEAERIQREKTLPYHERIQRYADEKRSVLPMCTTQAEVDKALHLLRMKWSV